jgi:nucleotide-binding universal stress UspA family protein
MFRSILLPLDLSDRHVAAVDVAAELASQSGGTVVLLHVVELIPGLPLDDEPTFYGRLEKAAQRHLEGIARRLAEEQRVATECRVVFGHRAREVVAQADALGSDLIVLTAPRLDAGDPSGWGSLSWKISVLAACPLLLVKQRLS